MHKVIDLFAGAGGLSLGFKQTGKYEIAAAFEINQNAQETYKKNHSGTKVFSDVCSADFVKLGEKLGNIDVVIGGPPCQGFSCLLYTSPSPRDRSAYRMPSSA